MKVIELEQGSPDWLAWRKTVITATDCPAILGSSPWSTAYKCWQRKLGHIEEQKSNDAMERGKALEPIIRERFIERFGINMTPVVVESSEYDFLGASLDGLSDCGKFILEVKTGGYNLYKMAQDGVIPEYYMHQMQHQLLVTKAEKCFYKVGHENPEREIVIEVFPDAAFPGLFLPKAREFLKCIALDEPPALQDADYRNMSNQGEWESHATEYRNLCAQIKNLEVIKDSYRKELIKMCGDHNCLGSGIKVIKTTMKGRVVYEDIPEIKNVDLDKYRKSATTSWKILVE